MILNYAVFLLNEGDWSTEKFIFRVFPTNTPHASFQRSFCLAHRNLLGDSAVPMGKGIIDIHEDLTLCKCEDADDIFIFREIVSNNFNGDVFDAVTSLQGKIILKGEHLYANSG